MSHPIYIIGHRNPDADAICSAIAYAALKEALGEPGHLAARCGNSNARIDAILRRFQLPLPTFIGDVTPRVRDIMKTEVRKITLDGTCHHALELIDRYDIRSLPVVDGEDKVQGLISIFHLGEFFIPKPKNPRAMRYLRSSITHIVNALEAKVLNQVDPDRIEDLYVRVGAMDIRSFGSWTTVEGTAPEESVIVVGDREDIQLKAIGMGARLLVVTGNLEVKPAVLEAARERGVSLAVSRFDSATTSWIVRLATLLEPMVQREFVSVSPSDKLSSVRRKVVGSSAQAYLVLHEDGTLAGLFTKTDLLKPTRTRLILVDHNELGQAVPGADQVDILEIIDHHRLANPPTSQPILFRNEVIGSTCSIVAELFRSHRIDPDPAIAGIMACGLISDTLNLRSPTTTDRDRTILPWLTKLAGTDADTLTAMIFESGSIILSAGPDQVIRSDCKAYEQGEIHYSVSQVEELGLANFWQKAESLEEALEAYRHEQNLTFSSLLVTDINSQNSVLVVRGASGFEDFIPYPRIRNCQNIYDLPGIVSRKKQLVPFLTNLLESAGSTV